MYVLAVDVYSVYLEGQFISFIPSVNICVNKMSSFTAHICGVPKHFHGNYSHAIQGGCGGRTHYAIG